ncbi:MAG TPA: type VI secretion system tube protein Hcp, partial [Chitinophagaceae bacterium]|nr:type VI secretion system tube protein Hcp [Chitinophagaceae bacterium]
MKKILFTTSCFILFLITNAQTIVLKVDGMKGESDKAKFKDKTELLGFVMEGAVLQSTSTAGGMSAGKRSYQPITILKQTGAISPLLFQNFYLNKHIREVVVEYYKTDNAYVTGKTGAEVLDYTVTFKNVKIIGF